MGANDPYFGIGIVATIVFFIFCLAILPITPVLVGPEILLGVFFGVGCGLGAWALDNPEEEEPEEEEEEKEPENESEIAEKIASDKKDPFHGVAQGILQARSTAKQYAKKKPKLADGTANICRATEDIIQYLGDTKADPEMWLELLENNVKAVHDILYKFSMLLRHEDNEVVKATEAQLEKTLESIHELNVELLAKLIGEDADNLRDHAELIAETKAGLKRALPTI